MPEADDTEILISDGRFSVSLLSGELCVLSIPTAGVPLAAWWLFREYVLDLKKSTRSLKYKSEFNSILMDDDGLSVICNPSELALLESLNIQDITVSPKRWRALVINVIGSAAEFPGAVYYLASALSEKNISILHISTFESEIFLVQEQDLELACSLLRSRAESNTDLNSFLRRNARSLGASGNTDEINHNMPAIKSHHELLPSDIVLKERRFKEGFELCVLPCSVMLARLSEDFKLHQCGDILVNFLFVMLPQINPFLEM
jgi:hypothetical protein